MKTKLLFAVVALAIININAQVSTIDENFNTFTTGTGAIPQNGWNKVIDNAAYNIYMIAVTTGNNAPQYYAANKVSAVGYLISPQIEAPDGTKKIQFTTAASAGNNGGTTVDVGLVSSLTDMSTFQSLGSVVSLTAASITPQTHTVNVPASSSQYIAFKFIGDATHSAAYVDDVKYNSTTVLAVNNTKSNNTFNFGISNNSEIKFVGNAKSLQIYSTAGNLTTQGEVKNNTFDISALKTGVYILVAENANGSVLKSKFIKK